MRVDPQRFSSFLDPLRVCRVDETRCCWGLRDRLDLRGRHSRCGTSSERPDVRGSRQMCKAKEVCMRRRGGSFEAESVQDQHKAWTLFEGLKEIGLGLKGQKPYPTLGDVDGCGCAFA